MEALWVVYWVYFGIASWVSAAFVVYLWVKLFERDEDGPNEV